MKNFTTMRFRSLLVELFLLSLINGETSHECKEISDKSVTQRLKDYLFCNYVWSDHDTKSNATVVTMEILPKFATMDEYEGNLELYTWMYITWKDEHLSWDPSLFENIRRFGVDSSEIWVPDIAVQSPGNDDVNVDGLANGRCEIHFDGKVACSPRHRQTIRCKTDFTLWPYDRQNCTFVISSSSDVTRQIEFGASKTISRNVFMHDFVTNGEWEIAVSRIAYEQTKFNNFENRSSPKLSVDFILDRVHERLSGRYVTPGIIMMVMTLTTVWLNPRSIERLAIACLNPIIHLLCIHDLNWILPRNGNTVPNIVLFYTNSFVLAIVALLLTFLLGKLGGLKISAPGWIATSISTLFNNKIGQNLLLISGPETERTANNENDAEDNDLLVCSETDRSIWACVVILLVWSSFLIFFFAYIVMWSILIPNTSMRTPIIDVSKEI